MNPVRFSVVVPVWNPTPEFLEAMIASVVAQTYPHWELCLADGNSDRAAVLDALRKATRDPRIKVAWLGANRGIAGNSNAALARADGDFIALLDHDDVLAPSALYEVAQAIQRRPEADFIYSDEDKLDGALRKDPHFKPDWSPETLRGQNYITHLTVIRRDLLDQVGGFHAGFDGSQDYDLILRATEKARTIVHIPRVLYHWRCHDQSVAARAEAKTYAYTAGRLAIEEHLRRTNQSGCVRQGSIPGTYILRYAVSERPLVSIIISRSSSRHIEKLCQCLTESSYGCVEVIAVSFADGGQSSPPFRSLVRQLNSRTWRRSAQRNLAAAAARGDVLVFMGPALIPSRADWLESLLGYVVRSDIGAVGARITQADGSLHAGAYALGVTGLAGTLHRGFAAASPGYACGLITAKNVSASSGDALAVRRCIFQEAGGFDPGFRHTLDDVDFCLRLGDLGYRIVWAPEIEFRMMRRRDPGPPQDSLSCAADRTRFQERWARILRTGDPCYSPNLTTDWDDCSLAL
jgi:GT2 family glycosyltransferase